MDLVQWLRAQYDAEAVQATAALAGRDGAWKYVETPGGDHRVLDSLGYSVVEDSPVESEPWFTLPHIAAHDPARVLREIDAKRRRLALHHAEWIDTGDADGNDRSDYFCAECDVTPFPCRTLRLEAAPYEDRPGYLEKWRP